MSWTITLTKSNFFSKIKYLHDKIMTSWSITIRETELDEDFSFYKKNYDIFKKPVKAKEVLDYLKK
jgi:hypothetical protein